MIMYEDRKSSHPAHVKWLFNHAWVLQHLTKIYCGIAAFVILLLWAVL